MILVSGSFIINVSGKSSTGKSTITEVAGSLFANPILSQDGIVRGFNATKNALLAAGEGRNGLPILLDDLNANSSEHNRVDLVYQLAGNEPRGRCQNSGDLQSKRKGWAGLVLITSEAPMFDNANVPQGVNARVLNLDDIIWTQDAEHSNRIKDGVRKNYGHFGLEFAKKVKEIGKEEIYKAHKEAQKYLESLFKETDSLASRLSLKMASIKVAADILKNYFFDDFKSDEVIQILVDAYDKTMDDRAIEEKTLEEFKDFIKSNIKHFSIHTEEASKEHSGELYGAVIINRKEETVNVLKPIFLKFVKDNKITEQRRIIKYWKEKKYIKAEEGHNDIKVNALGNARAIKLILNSAERDFFQADLYEPRCRNCGEHLTPKFGTTKPEALKISEIPEITYDETDNIDNIFGGTTDED